MKEKTLIQLIGASIILLILLAGQFFEPEKQITAYVSAFGYLSLISLIFVIALPLIARIWRNPIAFKAVANRRWIGIFTFIFAAVHVFLVSNFFFSWNLLPILTDPNYFFLLLGAVAFLILAAMAATSNDFSVKSLGANWKRLQLLIYPATLLVLIHFINAGQIFAKESAIVAATVALLAIVLILKFKPFFENLLKPK